MENERNIYTVVFIAREECRCFCEWTSPTLSLQGRYKEVGEYSVIKYYHETDKKEKKVLCIHTSQYVAE